MKKLFKGLFLVSLITLILTGCGIKKEKGPYDDLYNDSYNYSWTTEPIKFNDEDYEEIDFTINGDISYKIKDKELFHNNYDGNSLSVEDYVKVRITSALTDIIKTTNETYGKYGTLSTLQEDMSKELKTKLETSLGIECSNISVGAITLTNKSVQKIQNYVPSKKKKSTDNTAI